VCRSERQVGKNVKDKLSIISDVSAERIYNLWDAGDIYRIPITLRENGIDKAIFDVLELSPKADCEKNLAAWRKFVERTAAANEEVSIGIVGKYTYVHDSYLSVLKALEHSASSCGVKLKIRWIESAELEKDGVSLEEAFSGIDGIIVPGGFGKRGTEGKISAIGHARRNNIPYLGLCLGMQLAVVEFARNVCGMSGANSTEFDHSTASPVIDIMPEQASIVRESRYGGTMRLGAYPAVLAKGSAVESLYTSANVLERHRHRYEVNPKYIEALEKKGIVFSGRSPNGVLMEFMELKGHPFFVATQAHPELKSRPVAPAPLFLGFMKAALERKRNLEKRRS
jgi:CTP synthase